MEKAKKYRWTAVDIRIYSNVVRLQEEADFLISKLQNSDTDKAKDRAKRELEFLFSCLVEGKREIYDE